MRVLIVDDNLDRSNLINELVKIAFGSDTTIHTCQSYSKAILHLKDHFNLLLIDHILGDGYGRTFADAYARVFPESIIRLYSAEPECVDESDGIKCYPFASIKGEILAVKMYFMEREKGSMLPENRGVDMGEPFLQKLCDEKHKNLDLKVNKIDSNVEKLINKLDRFNFFLITTLVGALASIAISCIK